jgi:hypothetical protein
LHLQRDIDHAVAAQEVVRDVEPPAGQRLRRVIRSDELLPDAAADLCADRIGGTTAKGLREGGGGTTLLLVQE